MSLFKTIDFVARGDDRGSLVALEEHKEIPFQVKRVYYIFNTQPDVARGFHAHKNLEQLVFAVSGACDFVLDDGLKREVMRLDSPTKGVYINTPLWREMHNFTPDCVLMVLASEVYDEADYIRDYETFKKSMSYVYS